MSIVIKGRPISKGYAEGEALVCHQPIGFNFGIDVADGARAEVAGAAETSVTDPNNENFCSFGTNLICLGFVWQNGIMTPLSTLGGNNGQAAAINNRGQVAGYSETAIADPNCPVPQVLQFRPTLWTAGQARALPLYPGDTEGAAFWINNQGETVGASGSCAPCCGGRVACNRLISAI